MKLNFKSSKKTWIVIFLLLFSALPLFAQHSIDKQSLEKQNFYTGPIIDMHLHSYSDDFWGPAPNPATGDLSGKTAKEQMEQTFEIMNKYNIVLGAVPGVYPESGNMWHSFDKEKTFRGIELREPSEFITPERFREMILEGEIDMLEK